MSSNALKDDRQLMVHIADQLDFLCANLVPHTSGVDKLKKYIDLCVSHNESIDKRILQDLMDNVTPDQFAELDGFYSGVVYDCLPEYNQTEPDWLHEIAKCVGNCYTVPADSYLFGRKVLAFKIVGYSTLSPLKDGTKKIRVIELWREGSTGFTGSSVNVSRAEYTFTISTEPKDIYDDFMAFMSDFCEVGIRNFDELIHDTISEV